MKTLGILLLIGGFAGLLYAWNMETTVKSYSFGAFGDASVSEVNNIGLMNDKQNAIIIAGIVAVVGVGLMVAGAKKDT